MGIKKHSEEGEKRMTVALRVVLAFRKSGLNNNSSPRTTISSSFTSVSMLVHISNPYYPLSHSLRA